MIRKIAFTMYPVKDMQRARNFYEKIFLTKEKKLTICENSQKILSDKNHELENLQKKFQTDTENSQKIHLKSENDLASLIYFRPGNSQGALEC